MPNQLQLPHLYPVKRHAKGPVQRKQQRRKGRLHLHRKDKALGAPKGAGLARLLPRVVGEKQKGDLCSFKAQNAVLWRKILYGLQLRNHETMGKNSDH